MPSGVVSVGVLADFAELIEQSDAAGVSIEGFAGRVVTSARSASRAMADYAKAAGASADEAKAAAAETSAAWNATYGTLSKSSKDAGNAALATSRMYKESADEQTAAFAKAAEAQSALEAQQKAAAAAAQEAAARTAAAAKAAADEQVAAAKKAAAGVTAAGKSLASVGKWALFGDAAGVAVSVKGAADLQTAMERLHTQAGVTQGNVKALTSSVLGMAGSLATSPDALAQSLYHVESGGIHGANALKVMATAAKEAKVSGADLTDTTTALTATVYSGIAGAQNYAKAMGLLNATVGAGDMTFQDLNEALGGPMLATVKGYGLSLKDVGAALATFGDDNIRGADAATQLRMAVQYMAKPAATAGPILQKLGLSTTSFADAMSKGGLLPALQLLHDKLVAAQIPANDYGQVISDIFSKKGASGVTILENSLTKLETKYQEVGKGAGQVNQAWSGWNHTLQADVDHLAATVKALADKFGMYLIPKLEGVAHAASDVIDWFGKNKAAAEALGITIATVLGAAVTAFVYQKATAFVSGVKNMAAGVSSLTGKILQWPAAQEEAQSETAQLTAAVQELTGALTAAGGEADATVGQLQALGGTAADTAAQVEMVGARAEQAGGQLSMFDGELEATVAQLEAVTTAAEATGTAIAGVGADATAAGSEIGAIGAGAGIGTGALVGGAATGFAAAFAGFLLATKVPKGPNPMQAAERAGQYDPYGPLTSPVPKRGQAQYQSGDASKASRASIAALAELRKQIAAIKDPATLSAAQLNKLYTEAEHLAGMKGVTAKQHAAVAKLEAALTPAAPSTGTGMVLSQSWLKAAQGIGGLSSSEQTNAAAIMAALTRGGLSTAGAAAITGNWVQESSLNPNEQGGLLAQWSSGRLANEQAYAQQQGLAYNSIPAETGFALQELKGTPGLLAMLQSGKLSPQQLALAVENKYEEPLGTAHNAGYFTPDTYWSANTAGRETYASEIYSAFSGQQTSGSLVGTTPGSSGSSNSILQSIQNLGSGSKLPAVLLAASATKQATQLQDQVTRMQAVGQAMVTVLQAVNQQIQDVGKAGTTGRISRLLAGSNEYEPSHGVGRSIHLPGAGGNDATLKSIQGEIADMKNIGAGGVQTLKDLQQVIDDRSAKQVETLKDQQQSADDRSANVVQKLKDQQQSATDQAAAQVQQMKDQQAVADEKSAIVVQAIKDQTQIIQDTSALQVAAIQGMATRIADAANAAATLVGDNAQTQAATISERGLYGLNLVAQKLQVQADDTKAYWDQQIATAQQQLDTDQEAANVANAQAQLTTAQVTATQNQNVLAAQQNLNLVTLKQDALVAKAQAHVDAVTLKQQGLEATAQQHLDSVTSMQNARVGSAQLHLDQVTLRQDARANAAKAHMDAVTITQDNRILQATQHADAVQLQVDTTKIGPAQIAVDLAAGKSKTIQEEAQANLNLATAQGNVTINQSQLQLASVTANANSTIAGAQNAYQSVQNAANTLIQGAQDSYNSAQDAANLAIQQATGNADNVQNAANLAIQQAQGSYQSAQDTANQMVQAATDAYQAQQDAANKAIASAQQTQASTAAMWAQQLANDQAQLSGVQGQAAVGEAGAQGAVTNEQALASTEFAGSGLVVNIFGTNVADPTEIGQAASWAIRSSGLATV